MRYLGHTDTKCNSSSISFKSHILQTLLLSLFLYLPVIELSLHDESLNFAISFLFLIDLKMTCNLVEDYKQN